MIAPCIDERHVGRGYDPYNSADQPYVLAAMSAKRYNEGVDRLMRRGFKMLTKFEYRADRAQLTADALAMQIEFNRQMNASGARQFGPDSFLVGRGQLNPPI